MKLLITIALFAGALCAQTVTPAPEPLYPQYIVSMGGGYNRNATPNAAEGWVSAAVNIGGATYSVTTIDMTSTASTLRTGFARVMAQSGNTALLARVDAGIGTPVPTIGSFSGGAIMTYNLKGVSSRMAGWLLIGEIRITGATSSTPAIPNQVNVGGYFGIGKAF